MVEEKEERKCFLFCQSETLDFIFIEKIKSEFELDSPQVCLTLGTLESLWE